MLQELVDRVKGGDGVARTVQDALAPLKLLNAALYDGLYDDAVGYVLEGTTPEVLARVAPVRTDHVDSLLDQPGRTSYYSRWVAPDLVKQVAALHKNWTQEVGNRSRRRIYADAGVETVVRFARLLAQICETVEMPGVPGWLSLLLHDTSHLSAAGRKRSARSGADGSSAGKGAGARWTPAAFEAAAVEGGVPADDAVHTVLLGILHRSTKGHSWHTDPRTAIATTPAFDEYVTQHVSVLATLTPRLNAAGKTEVLDRIGKRVADDGLARIVAALAVDGAKGVRNAALTHLAALPDARQVALLAPSLTTAPSGSLGEAVSRLASLDGGLDACGAALAPLVDENGKAASGQNARVRLLAQTIERSRALESPAKDVTIELPAWEPLPDPVLDDALLKEVRAVVETATVEARARLEELKKRFSHDSKDWSLQAARRDLGQLQKITDKDFEALPTALAGGKPIRNSGKDRPSPLILWLADQRRDPFAGQGPSAGQGLMLRIRLHVPALGRGNRHNVLWSLHGHLGDVTDLRQLHEGLERVGAEDVDGLLTELVLDRWWGTQEITAAVAWPWFAERPQLLERALRRGEGGDGRTARALEILRQFPAIPPHLLPSVTALALGTGKTHRRAAQEVLEAHSGARLLAEQALTDPKAEIRTSAAAWLARIGDPAAVPALRAVLKKERREAARATLLSALEALGDDIATDLAPEILRAEAVKGLTGKMPASLGWFPFDQLPQVRWAGIDGTPGDEVPSDVVRWWVVLATKLKSPSGEGLIARYVGLLDPQSQAVLGSFVLRAWLAQDTRNPSVDESRTYADQNAQTRWDSMQALIKRYPEYYGDQAEQSVEDFWKILYKQHQATYLGSATQEKGLLALTVGMPGAELATTAQHYFSAHKGRRAQAEYLVRALAANGDRAAVQQLLAVSRRFKQRSVQEVATALAQDIADRNGWDAEQLADRTVQTAGFDDDGILRLDLGAPDGDRVVTGRITEAFTLELRNPTGKVVKALPAQRASDDAETYAEAKRQLKESRAELKAVVTLQTQRFAEAMVTDRTWPFADWREFVLGHPLMSRLAARLVWAADRGSSAVTFRPGDGGALIGVDDEDVTLPDDARVSLVHATTLGEDTESGAPAWRAHLADYEITPLFDQGLGADAPPAADLLPDVPEGARAIETRKGWLSDSFTIRGRATKLGYARSQAEDAGWFDAYRKEYSTLGVTVEIEFTGAFLPEENITAAVRQLVFRRTGTWGDQGCLPVKDVPKALLAVSYRDYVTVAEGGVFDPDWEKKSQY
ncbi:DUF4132 domain-containing protein [Promicromonospora iranensis]|uniref:HEAT repeat protein n=1 Tax=Promicromonospora iranensis TaxID=1105144 RepID=A0ABU2CTX5_9MICO|nr:DUF4132 domain-containing protein [Promicromonospora iranensis]MDR7384799.1 HEAT repeat protein [Promicromonospora iranensis]